MNRIDDNIEVLEPGKRFSSYWGELWQYRELFYFLSWRDFLVRYKQTVLGVAWSVIRPILTMIVFTVVFGKLAKFPSEGVPYAIMVYCALLPWQFFATTFSEAGNSLLANARMLTKIYFPRLIIPASSLLVNLIDFFISFVILLGLMAYYQFMPSWKIVFIPVFLFMAMITSLGAGVLIVTLNVKYRDFRYVVPFVVQLGLYVSPVGFSSNIIPGKWQFLYSLNPMVGVIDGFRWSILGEGYTMNWAAFSLSAALTVLFFFISVTYFKRMEKSFADII
ncbi:MAG: ABC transporter permease [Flavobacteriales bacterium]|jgi:lipopolysaccharide transport system permease protein|nr:ABC transporter permease [Flavobacteriales bacterium]MBT6745975.1 ABC transporter permease [Flavobacteriales bacterium]